MKQNNTMGVHLVCKMPSQWYCEILNEIILIKSKQSVFLMHISAVFAILTRNKIHKICTKANMDDTE